MIAEPTRRNNVAEHIAPTLRDRHQVLRGTPKALHCRDRDTPALRKVLWIGDPHWELTIEAAAGLSIVSTPAKGMKSVTHKGSKYVVEPRITRQGYQRASWERMIIRQPQINAVNAALPPSPL